VNNLTVADLQRFWSKIEPNPVTKCWNWGGSFQADKGNGKGKTPKLIINKQEVNARRLAWQVAFGDHIPPFVGVSCENDRCINPSHLTPAQSPAALTRHAYRPKKTADWQLTTPKLVRRVMTLRRKGWSLAKIAEDVGVSPARVQLIAKMASMCQQGKLQPRKSAAAVD
jgi:hypothetical protein